MVRCVFLTYGTLGNICYGTLFHIQNGTLYGIGYPYMAYTSKDACTFSRIFHEILLKDF